jgi:hypothetical protein
MSPSLPFLLLFVSFSLRPVDLFTLLKRPIDRADREEGGTGRALARRRSSRLESRRPFRRFRCGMRKSRCLDVQGGVIERTAPGSGAYLSCFPPFPDRSLILSFPSAPFPLHFPPDSLFFESRPLPSPICSSVRATRTDLTGFLFGSRTERSDHHLRKRRRAAGRAAVAFCRPLTIKQAKGWKIDSRKDGQRKGKIACFLQPRSLLQSLL